MKSLDRDENMDDWRDYRKWNYDRIAQHENQRLTFTNIVLVISGAILLFGTRVLNVSDTHLVMLSIVVFVINLAALFFINESRFWVKYHQAHAEYARKKYAPYLPSSETGEIKHSLESKLDPPPKKDSNKNPFRRTELQKIVHGCLLGVAVFEISIRLGKFMA